MDIKNDSFEITDEKERKFLIDIFKYCYTVEEDSKITVEKFNHSTYSRSFFIHSNSSKKMSVSYLNCLLKIKNAAKKIKKENNTLLDLDLIEK